MSKMNPMMGGDDGGFGGQGGFGGIDFSKLGAAQGMGGLPDMGGDAPDSDEDDDEEMPELEDEKAKAAGDAKADDSKAEGKKIEEVA